MRVINTRVSNDITKQYNNEYGNTMYGSVTKYVLNEMTKYKSCNKIC